jgi:hypothetical protein
MRKRTRSESKNAKDKARATESAGAWNDLDWEDLAEKLDKWRHEPPSSRPIEE